MYILYIATGGNKQQVNRGKGILCQREEVIRHCEGRGRLALEKIGQAEPYFAIGNYGQ